VTSAVASQYKALRLNHKAWREAWLVEDPDAIEERRALYEDLRKGYNEYNNLHGKATYRKTGGKTKQRRKKAQPPKRDSVADAAELGDAADKEGVRDRPYDAEATGANALRPNSGTALHELLHPETCT
jgi:hypothetical protein